MADKMWAYLIHLSTNMWGDPGSHFKLKPYYPEFHTDEAVWRKVIDFLPEQGFNTLLIDVGDAVQYATHPEIAVRGAWSREKLKSELDYIRSKGLTPIPKLNFSACHDAWLGEYGYMICTKKYYQVCADLIGEIAELFDNPAYLHLGLDEEGLECQKDYSVCHIRIGEQWWHDAFFLFDECAKHGMRPWVWADPCWHNPDEYLRRMPRSVLQSNWWYDPMPRGADGVFTDHRPDTYRLLDKAGFDQVLTACSTWSYQFSDKDTLEYASEDLRGSVNFKGVIAAPWQLTTQEDYYTLLDEANRFGLAKKQFFPAE
ncbi:MAG: hypothetical protein MR418_01355 [Clostridiales bacterium]|nr:hypothetical protein [Clostridiales bacterium]